MRYETSVTISVRGEERDRLVCGDVEVGYDIGPNGFGATCENLRVRIGRSWVPAEDAELGEGDIARATEALEELALNDDSDQCVEHDDFDDERCCA